MDWVFYCVPLGRQIELFHTTQAGNQRRRVLPLCWVDAG